MIIMVARITVEIYMTTRWYTTVPLNMQNIQPLYRSLSYSIAIFGHVKLCLATGKHNCNWLKMYEICEVPIYISVSISKTDFIFTN